MSEKFYLNSDFYKISTDINEIQKTFEKIKLADFTEIVQMERYPSNSTLLSLPLNSPRPKKLEDDLKRNKMKMRSEPNLMGSAEPRKSPRCYEGCFDSDYELSICDIERLESTEDIDVTFRSLPGHAAPKKSSRTSHFYSKLKESFYKFSRRRGTKNGSNAKIEVENPEEDEASFKLTSERKPALSNKYDDDDDDYDDNLKNELHRGITILSGKSYYFRNGIYIDDQRSEYQMSCPKTMQSVDKRSEIQTLILPETSMIPIRQDSPVRLTSLKYLPESTRKASHGNEGRNINEEGEEAIRSLSVDVASSSLNLSDANSNNFESSTNEGSSSLDSYDDAYGEGDEEDEDDEEEESTDTDTDDEAEEELELEDEAATTTIALTGTTTRVPTVLVRNLLGSQATSHATALPPMMLSFNQLSSSAVPSSSSSSAVSSYCSILLSPEYLHKRTQSA